MIGLSQKQTNIIVILLFSVWLFKERHNFSFCFLYFGPCSNNCDLFVLLLYIVERMIDLFEGNFPTNSKLSHSCFFLETNHAIDNCLYFIRIEVYPFNFQSRYSFFDIFIGPDDVILTALDKQFACSFQRIALLICESSMIVHCHLVGFLNLVQTCMPRANQPLYIQSWNRYIGLSYSHLHLQLVDDLICNFDYLLKYFNLLLVPNYCYLCAFQKVVCCVLMMDIQINLCPYFLD